VTNLFDGMRVLIAEDDFIIAADLEQLFVERGAKVEVTATVPRVPSDTAPPWRLALVDRHLRDGDSLAAVRRLRERGVAVVLQTGDQHGDLAELSALGIEVAIKPTTEDTLIACCRRALDAAGQD
jgi:DNA-binding response OmpR family regulator